MSESFDIARALIDRAANTGKNYAVFVRHGSAKVTNTTTEEYRKTMDKRGGDLLGIYNKNCPIGWLVEDLRWKGIA